ncbi:hypothetical protein [Pseudomonas versuta]|nr:hypothetical protein [Pseudomonas versuta]
MNIKLLVKYNPAGLVLLMVLLVGQLVWQASAQAFTARITAEFTPSRNNPNNRTFTNTTPLGGVCSGAHIVWCTNNNVFSVGTGLGGADGSTLKKGSGVSDHGRGSIYFDLPEQRVITVISDTGETAELFLRISGVAFRYGALDPTSTTPSSLLDLRGCREVYGNGNSVRPFRIIMRNDNGAGGRSSCAYEMLANEEMVVASFDFIYEIETPEPLNMKNGIYRGSSTYSMGSLGSDLDIGDELLAIRDTSLTIDFELKVNHLFALEFPPGSETAILQPLGGWSQWTDYKKVPATLRKDQHFTVSGSTNFSVNLNCEYLMPDGRCGISNGVSTVPLDVAITMPGFLGRADLGFAEALNYPLTQSFTHVPRFSPKDGATFQRRSYLRFEVNGDPIKEMVTHPGTQYKGRVTVIFDADM